MYEFSVAAKYLTPRWKQLSVSIISIISILVITAVVWLIVVFFSVTSGLTNSWLDKLIALTAPIRITPTQEYYHSHYHLIDSLSAQSDYTLKSIGEKLVALQSDPHDPLIDEEIPLSWPPADRLADDSLKDPVKTAFGIIEDLKEIKGLTASDFEMTVGNLQLRLLEKKKDIPLDSKKTSGNHRQAKNRYSFKSQGSLVQASYLGSLDPNNPWLLKAVVSPTPEDLENILNNLSLKTNLQDEEESARPQLTSIKNFRERLHTFFTHVQVSQLSVPASGWILPKTLFPAQATWQVVLLKKGNQIERIILPIDKKTETQLIKEKNRPGISKEIAELSIAQNLIFLTSEDGIKKPLAKIPEILVAGPLKLPVQIDQLSLQKLTEKEDGGAIDVDFNTHFSLQGAEISGKISNAGLSISKATLKTQFDQAPQNEPFWLYATTSKGQTNTLRLGAIEGMGEGVLLPKGFKEAGALLGDTGYLSYLTPTATSVQEQRLPIFVAGFYDPGIISIGSKYVIANKQTISQIRTSQHQEDNPLANGIHVRFDNRDLADHVKTLLQKRFEEEGIDKYWKIETYREYEFTRDIIQQLQSEKHLFTLLATLIIIVACSNIISMLVILVNDKKIEIGILRSMGATSRSIAMIFGTCGIIMGLIGSIIGTLAAFITLKNIQAIVDFISRLQGYEMFNPIFYGEGLPTEISVEALLFVVIATSLISLVAGIVPAVKASMLRPSVILKAG